MFNKFGTTGNKYMDDFEKDIFTTGFKKRVREARNTGHTTLME